MQVCLSIKETRWWLIFLSLCDDSMAWERFFQACICRHTHTCTYSCVPLTHCSEWKSFSSYPFLSNIVKKNVLESTCFIVSIKMICSLLAFLAFWLILFWSDPKCLPSSSQIASVWGSWKREKSDPSFFPILSVSLSWLYVLSLAKRRGLHVLTIGKQS